MVMVAGTLASISRTNSCWPNCAAVCIAVRPVCRQPVHNNATTEQIINAHDTAAALALFHGAIAAHDLTPAELSMGWVDPWVGLGWVDIFQFLVGWVGYTVARVLKI